MTISIEPKVSRKKRALFGAIATAAAAILFSLVVVSPPADPLSSPPVWLGEANAPSRLELVPGLYGERMVASEEYLSQFNSQIVSNTGNQPLLSLVR